jgi:hypothetical protein
MTSFCQCETCQKVKKQIENKTKIHPLCPYCKEHHDSRVHCIAEIKQKGTIADKINTNPKQFIEYDKGGIVPGQTHFSDDEIEIVRKKISKEFIKSESTYFIDIANGKYSVYQKEDGGLSALRYGEQWRDLCGDNLIFNMMVELIEAKEKLNKIKFLSKYHNNRSGIFETKPILDIINGEK